MFPEQGLEECRITYAFRYSSKAPSTVSSVDHSVLYPSSRTSIHGFSIFKTSSFCTVFSSINRAPQRQETMIFCTSCVCGPAAGPTGTEHFLPSIPVPPLPEGKKMFFRNSENRPGGVQFAKHPVIGALYSPQGSCYPPYPSPF